MVKEEKDNKLTKMNQNAVPFLSALIKSEQMERRGLGGCGGVVKKGGVCLGLIFVVFGNVLSKKFNTCQKKRNKNMVRGSVRVKCMH